MISHVFKVFCSYCVLCGISGCVQSVVFCLCITIKSFNLTCGKWGGPKFKECYTNGDGSGLPGGESLY